MEVALIYGANRLSLISSGYLVKESFRMQFAREDENRNKIVGDIHVKLSNMDGTFSGIFQNWKSDLNYEEVRCEVYGVDYYHVLFSGLVQQPVSFDPENEYCEFDAFSYQKIFYELAGQITIRNKPDDYRFYPYYSRIYMAFFHFLDYIFCLKNDESLIAGDTFPLSDMIKSIDCTWDLQPELIRLRSSDADHPNIGTFYLLDRTTTLKEMMDAISQFYNVEWILDYPNRKLIVQKRSTPSSTQHDISASIKRDKPIQWQSQSAPYDYIHTILEFKESVPSPSVSQIYVGTVDVDSDEQHFPLEWFMVFVNPTVVEHDFYYNLSGVFPDGNEYISPPIKVTLGGYFNYRQINTIDYYDGYRVKIWLPKINGAIKRRLYRNAYANYGQFQSGGESRCVYEDSNGADLIFDDVKPFYSPVEMFELLCTDKTISMKGWIGYDNINMKWHDPIYENLQDITMKSFLVGKKVFEMIPTLRFQDSNFEDIIITDENYRVYLFFGKNLSPEKIKNNFANLLIAKKTLSCTVEDIDYRDGEEIILRDIINGMNLKHNMVIRAASPDMMDECTEIEAVEL